MNLRYSVAELGTRVNVFHGTESDCDILIHMSDVTQLLDAAAAGDARAAGELLPLIYDELRKLAAAKMALEKPGQTLDATALVHEAYLRLVGDQQFSNRGHFFAAAAEVMRRILVEAARRKRSGKHGGDHRRVDLEDIEPATDEPNVDLIALDDALDRLAKNDPRKAELVKLRFFAGLTIEQAAHVLGISTSTADNDWAYAKCWLRVAIKDSSVDALR